MAVSVLLADAVTILLALAIAWQTPVGDLWGMDQRPEPGYLEAGWVAGIWLLALALHGTYSRPCLSAGVAEHRSLLLASLLASVTVPFASHVLDERVPPGALAGAFLLGVPLILLERVAAREVVRYLRGKGHLARRVVVVGDSSTIGEICSVLTRELAAGLQVVGCCLPGDAGDECAPANCPCLGVPHDAPRICADAEADTVLISGGWGPPDALRRLSWDLKSRGIDLMVAANMTDVSQQRVHLEPAAGLPLIHVDLPRVAAAGGVSKRLFDIVFALLVILTHAPLMLLAAALIKLEDRGPVLFGQTRVGRDGDRFPMLKFRSMVVGAELKLDELKDLNEAEGPLFKVREDPRITRVGHFLRRYSIDELPQVFNVLKGDMSIVGPRPPLPSEAAMYEGNVGRRLLVRPGMTGLWQVSGRSQLGWQDTVRLDLYYVDNWSMASDLAILARTVSAVLTTRGAS